MLKVSDINYIVAKQILLNKLSFEVKSGEILAIVGPNGAGKSTLLHILSGELIPSAGKILLNNKPLDSFSAKSLACVRGILSQQHPVSLPFTVAEIVMMGRYPYFEFYPSPEDKEVVRLALNEVNISHLGQRFYQTLSGGEQQRVQLSRVLAQVWESKNACLLLDEPTASLDLLHQHEVADVARRFARKGYCVVIVLHDLNLALQYADRVILLNKGEIFASGTPVSTLTPENIEQVFQLKTRVLSLDDLSRSWIVTL